MTVQQRNDLIKKLALKGMDMSKIGLKLDITRERVRQIINELGIDIWAIREKKRKPALRLLEKKFDKLAKKYQRIPTYKELNLKSCEYLMDHAKKLSVKYKKDGYKKIHADITPHTTLIKELKRISKIVGHVPTSKEVLKHSVFAHTTFYYRFGSMQNAQIAAGFKPNQVGQKSTITKQDLIDQLRKVYNIVGHTPSCNELKNYQSYSIGSYFREFGSLKKAQRAAGLKPNKVGNYRLRNKK